MPNKDGTKSGGRKKGSPNKKTRVIADIIAQNGKTPAEFLQDVYLDEKNPLNLRIDAAKAAAPYVHSKLQSIEMSNPDGSMAERPTRVVLQGVASKAVEHKGDE